MLTRDWREAPLEAADRALCAFAVKLTKRPHAMTPADLEALRAEGLDDEAILIAVQVIGHFNFINRVADALGVDPEPWMPDEAAWRAARPDDDFEGPGA